MIGQKIHSENPRTLYCSTSMEALLGISSIPSSAKTSTFKFSQNNKSNFLVSRRESIQRICRSSCNGSASRFSFDRAEARPAGDAHKQRSNLESLFCYDKPIPEEIIEKPVGLSLGERRIGDNPRCPDCEAKGAILCMTCSGTGLYVDSILESQGIIVKVRCLGCGGTGNIMCSNCGGRGHLGV